MKDFFKGKATTAAIIIITVLLAGIAVFTAIRLYQLRSEAVAPTAPSESGATGQQPTPDSCDAVAFTISTEQTPTPTSTTTPTSTPTPTPTSTPTNTPTSTPTDSPTSTPTSTPADTPTPTPTEPPRGGGETPTPTPVYIAAASPTPEGQALPDAGFGIPVILGISLGLLTLIFALALAL